MKVVAGILLMAGLLPLISTAQTIYQVGAESRLVIKGTSTIHDWESEVEQVEGQGEFSVLENQVTDIRSLQIEIPVTSIKSGKPRMDRLTYDALRSETSPYIRFVFAGLVSKKGQRLIVKGDLQIAGVTQQVTIEGTAQVNETKISIEGQHSLKMTEYGITPPSAMMGSIKTGDEVILDFKLILIQ